MNGWQLLRSLFRVASVNIWNLERYPVHILLHFTKAVAAVAKLMSLIAKGLAKIGVKLQGQTFSPALLFIARKK